MIPIIDFACTIFTFVIFTYHNHDKLSIYKGISILHCEDGLTFPLCIFGRCRDHIQVAFTAVSLARKQFRYFKNIIGIQ